MLFTYFCNFAVEIHKITCVQLEQRYRNRIHEATIRLNRIKKRMLQVSIFRVLLFVSGVAGVICFYHYEMGVISVIVGITFIPFLLLVKYHTELFSRKEWTETLIRVNEDEISALHNDYTPFDKGEEFVDSAHRYTLDLDIFGNHSLFQAVNRTCTSFGKNVLANWLQHHSEDKDEIVSRQETVSELSQLTDFREKFRITGLLYKGEGGDKDEIQRWAEAPARFSAKSWVKPLIRLVPMTNVILFGLGLLHLISFNWFGLGFVCFVILSMGVVKSVTLFQSDFDKRLKILSTYAKLIRLIDRQQTKASLLTRLKSEFYCQDGKSTSEALKILETELNRLDLRNNQLLYIILEGLCFWQLRQVIRIEEWQRQYGKSLIRWLDALGEVDALCSLGNFAYNHPDYRYAIIADKPFVFKAKDLGHPLMSNGQCITNDVDVPSRPYFLIITGANMAGKSTYLRTIGINYILACTGAPCYGTSLEIFPAKLITSLRTTDSLDKHESYFFAELKRLKEIIDRLNRGEILFIILDEILKGTNSLDKQKGSFALIRQFMNLRANGIIATHDLLLGQLIDSFPDTIRNNCFEADITAGELTFSYRLRPGIAQNMNACFLMKKMGIRMEDI